MSRPPTSVAQAFADQAQACRDLGSPFMGQLMDLCANADWPAGAVTDRIFGWQGDVSARGQSVPLRLAGALHALRIQNRGGLAPVYPPHRVPDPLFWEAVAAALVIEATFIDDFLNSPPQTNEVRRSAALIPMGHWLADRFGLPLRISELGASGGLNLNWARYGLHVDDQIRGAADPVLTLTPDWTGPVPPDAPIRVSSVAGVDLAPLNPRDPDDALHLQAYLWPDQPDRLALTRAAMAAAETPVEKADAIDWLARRLTHRSGELHLIYSTIAWQYFPAAAQTRGQTLIATAGAAASESHPLAWFSMENDGVGPGAALTLRLWPGDLTLNMGRADFHGRWITWTDGL